MLSKRKITKLVSEGHVGAWDDPRLYTLPALRRRGVPPGAILSFVNELGVTKATTIIEIARFETSVRRYLEATVPRLMLVLNPVQVIIDNLPEDYLEMLEVPFSKDPAYGVSRMPALMPSMCSMRVTNFYLLFRIIVFRSQGPFTSSGMISEKLMYPTISVSLLARQLAF